MKQFYIGLMQMYTAYTRLPLANEKPDYFINIVP